MEGNPRKIADKYSALNQEVIDKASESKDTESLESYEDIGLNVKVSDDNGDPLKSFKSGKKFRINVSWKPTEKIAAFVVNIFKHSGEHVTAFRVEPPKGVGKFTIELAPLLGKGKYNLVVEMHDKKDYAAFESYEGASFIVSDQDIANVPLWSGLMFIDHSVEIDD
jgi:hypothetical protein